MRVDHLRHGAVTVLHPSGPIVEGDADEVASSLTKAMRESLGRYVVDLSDVPYVDSKGLERLAEASDRMTTAGMTLKLCNCNETVREVLEVTGLSPMFEFFADVPSAVRSFL